MSNKPRVWLAAPSVSTPTPVDHPTVRDSRLVTWAPDAVGQYHTLDGLHHASWPELRSYFDLVEVEVGPAGANR